MARKSGAARPPKYAGVADCARQIMAQRRQLVLEAREQRGGRGAPDESQGPQQP
jgi:hypothetical protein